MVAFTLDFEILPGTAPQQAEQGPEPSEMPAKSAEAAGD
jgi:hypothetical protein